MLYGLRENKIMSTKLSIIGLVSGMIAFTCSWAWLILNVNQPSHSSSDTIDEERRINTIQDFLTVSWLVATLLTIIIAIIVMMSRKNRAEETSNNSGKIIFVALCFIVTTPLFTYVFMTLMLDIVFRGI